MNKRSNFLILFCTLVFMLLTISAVNAETLNDITAEGTPKITWIGANDQLINHYHYSGGFLIGCTVYEYFQVTGGSGEVEMNADGYKESFNVEEGEFYKLSVDIDISTIPNQFTLADKKIAISSPSAKTNANAVIESPHDKQSGGRQAISTTVSGMGLELWEAPELRRSLDDWPVPKGTTITTQYNFQDPSFRKFIYDKPVDPDDPFHDFYPNDVIWGNGQFIAVGSNGTILNSNDGASWEKQETGTDENLFAVTWSGSKFVVVGDYSGSGNNGTILTSTDGMTWEHSVVDFGLTHDITWGDNQFVTVGDCGRIGRSPDGANWESVNLEEELDVFGLTGITWSGSQFVAVGFESILTSSDGVAWTEQISGTTSSLEAVTWGENQFVAVGLHGTIITSPDGEIWTEQTVETDRGLYGIVWNGSQFVAVGAEGTILTSPGGETWEEQSSGVEGSFIRSIAWSDELEKFLAISRSCCLITSSDGENWTVVKEPPKMEEAEKIYKFWTFNYTNNIIEDTYEINGKVFSYYVGPGGLRQTNVIYDNYQEITTFNYMRPLFARRGAIDVAEYILTVTMEGQGYTMPAEGAHPFEDGTEVELNATPADGWHFKEWTGDYTGTDPEITVTMDEDISLTAFFEQLDPDSDPEDPDPDSDFPKRRGHSSVVLDNGDIILMGGFLDFDIPANDVWKSEDDGETWEEINSSADWAARGWHSSVVLPDNSIVLLGGNDTVELYNDVWRSDDGGESWTELTPGADWSARESFASVVLDNGDIILMGGNDGDATWIEPDYKNDVWVSTDQGASWHEVTAPAEWSGRSGHDSVILDDGRVVLMGGYDAGGSMNDVWRSDDGGESWTELTVGADWMERGDFSSIVLSDDSILITGGLYFVDQMEEVAFHSDVWRSNDGGESWMLVTDDVEWVERFGHSCVVQEDEGIESIVLMGGRDVNWEHRNDVWRSDDSGESWEQIAGFPNPYIRVYPQYSWISGEEWPADTDISIEIFDDDALVFSAGERSDDYGYFGFDLYPFELEPGLEVNVEAETEGVTRSHIVKDLEITAVDMIADQVHGLADGPGSEVNVTHVSDYSAEKSVEAGPDRKWVADFSAEGLDYKVTDRIVARELDGEGNATYSLWFPPVMRANPAHNDLFGHNWPVGEVLNITIGDDPGDPDREYSVEVDESGDYYLWVGDDHDIVAGDKVTVATEDKAIVKEHVVTALRDVNVDQNNNTVSGRADYPGQVRVVIYENGYHWAHTIDLDVEPDGTWMVNFDGIYDIGPDTRGNVHQVDDEDDWTYIHWHVHHPNFTVDPTSNTIAVHQWPPHTELTITVGDLNNPSWTTIVETDKNGDYWANTESEYDIDTGDLITVTDGVTTKTHTVTSLRITDIDEQNNTISGIAEPGSEVEVRIYDHPDPVRTVVTGVDGTWQVNFTSASGPDPEQRAYDIGPGNSGNANQRDEDWDETHIYWHIHHPQPLTVYWQNNTTGLRYLWFMDDLEVIDAGGIGTFGAGAWDIVGVGDLDGDGKADIVWHNTETGLLYYWLMDGRNQLGAGGIGTEDNLNWSAVAVGDMNGSGSLDVIWENKENGNLIAWFLDGTAIIDFGSLPALDPGWSVVAAADMNSSGHTDLLVQNEETGERAVWLMEGLDKIASQPIGVEHGQNWQLSAAGDFNGNGHPDLVWTDTESGLRYVEYMENLERTGGGGIGMIEDLDWEIRGIK